MWDNEVRGGFLFALAMFMMMGFALGIVAVQKGIVQVKGVSCVVEEK